MTTNPYDRLDLDDADRWLATYTFQPLGHKHPPDFIIDQLLQRYPNKVKIKIYRGMNFSTKEKYDEFLSHIDNNTITFDGVSSWTPSYSQAHQFAITKPSYQLSLSTMEDYYSAQQSGEIVSGYRGLILTTIVDAGVGIDVNESHLGHESEIILPKGRYRIKIEEIKKFKDSLAETDINDLVLKIKNKNDDRLKYIFKNHINDLNDISKHHIFKLYQNTMNYPLGINPDRYFNTFNKAPENIQYTFTDISISYTQFSLYQNGLITDNDEKKIKNYYRKYLKEFINYIKYNENTVFVFSKTGISIQDIADFCDLGLAYRNVIGAHVRKQYNYMQTLLSGKLDIDYRTMDKYKEILIKIMEQLT